MPKYTFTRASVFEEVFTVVANSEQEALDMVCDGAPSVTNEVRGWVDWHDDEYELEEVEDELVTFVKSKDTV